MTIKKQINGTYTVDVSGGYNSVTGKQKRIVRKGIRTKQEAINIEQHLRIVELHENRYGKSVQIDPLYHLLKKEDMINNRKLSYITTQENNYNRHIFPYFKNTDIKKITYDDIYDFREHLKKKSHRQFKDRTLNNNSINKIMILLKKILDIGVKKGYYQSNPMTLLKKLPTTKSSIQYWTLEEFLHFKSLFQEDEYNMELFFTLLYFTGMRLGEALALKWSDINFQNATITINKTVYRQNGKNIIGTTKTKTSDRIISINSKLLNELKNWKDKQSEILKDYINNSSDLQCIQSNLLEIGKNSIEKIYKKVLTRDTNIKRIRIHDFRHSHASLLINQGEDYHIVKERLGHASIATTIDTYSHLYPSKQKSLADKLDLLY
ncbi:tyrosine-type recombinase/integrase [Granulicatella sp. zg-ZJ]|uniref:tyrosine-type recombinase/integrase n=1 Tax=unclassified Granulicatella TaxID=2630493 RepID=UPI0013BF567F|nr:MULTISPECIES: site-specific integrase [unclassified Granulicatella]MBS4751161.1 site-specific integrase [Carnobacteriaceae bacterium zg-ZUI78]NEW63330.1 tyrosine-type recombinase/integrase [Granulicatella sp. zg-ZJ]NEW66929.1 tyrosine-type recombinase/integrase [Granulicatella sp. zg-84]QMI85890.1 site-specific integrase [Carnobacteriaceae bacterium zg-84]